ncbi:MAG: hypothetical protein ACREKM_03940, partial [Longimicrobiales bacterium]
RTLYAGNEGVRTVQIDERSEPAALSALAARADSFDIVVFSPFISVSAYKGGLALPERIAMLVNGMAAHTPVIVASFGNPYLLAQLPAVQAYLIAWGQWETPQIAAARALLGQIDITGTLPIPLPAGYPIGHGIRRTMELAQ